MAGTTTPDSIAYVTTGDPVTLAAATATLAGSAQNALNVRQVKSYKWTNAAGRTGQLGMTKGDVGDQADTNITYRYDGTNWNPTTAGTYLIIPTSATGATVSQTGRVSFTNSGFGTAIQINGCFSAAYDNYKIIFNSPTAASATAIQMRLSLAGTPDTAANYDITSLAQTNTAVSGAQTLAGTLWSLTGANSTISDIDIDIYSPAIAVPTRGFERVMTTTNPMTTTATYQDRGMLHRASTAYDGLTFISTLANISGSIYVYGYNRG